MGNQENSSLLKTDQDGESIKYLPFCSKRAAFYSKQIDGKGIVSSYYYVKC